MNSLTGRRTVTLVLAGAALAGCGGPKTAPPPTNAEAVAAFRGEFLARIDAVAAAPGTASREMDLAIESLTGYADSQGEPFHSWLETAKRIRASWGGRPTPAQVAEGLNRLRTLLSATP